MIADPDNSKQNPLAEELSRLVQSLTAAGKSILPGSSDELLKSIVEAAARIFGAAAASILLVNEAEGVLEFKVAHGIGSEGLVGVRIPLNHGIAGYVAISGQPISISDVAQDTRFNRDFAKSTGYVPRSILATPLFAGDRVIGVMEVLDKISAPSFGMQDMELLGLFARQAGLAIDQAQNIENIDKVLLMSLKQLAASGAERLSSSWMDDLTAKTEAGTKEDLMKIAQLLNEFSRMGESEREMAIKILSTFAENSKKQRRMSMGAGW